MFTHLHVHTEYSLLDGISRIPDLVEQTTNLGMNAVAITDHGALYGVVDFYSACKEAGIKPIIGCEVYVAHGSRLDKTSAERSPHHLVLLAQDNTGYRNLMRLVTQAHVDGFHYRPRIDKGLLQKHHEGLIVLSGCPSAEVPRLLVDGNVEEAYRVTGWYKELFGDNYFLELQQHQYVPQLPAINEKLPEMSRRLGIPLVATNDAHYVRQNDSPLQDIYICIQTNTTIKDEKRLKMEDDSYFIKSPQQMAALFPDFPEAIKNTEVIAERCNVELGFGQTHLPKYPVPGDLSADEYLAKLCWEGFRRWYPHLTPKAEHRLQYELEVIKHTRFANYFLVVWDIIEFVHRNNIMYAVRGSAAASVALYCLGITTVDPLQYRLVFERFLNVERKEMPDIDMDFQDDRRDEVLHYVIQRYGSDRVAQIITFGTLGAKASLRDVGRSLAISYGEVDRIARMVPFKARTLADALKANPEMQDLYEADDVVRKLIDTSQPLEGIVHHVSTHAAGVLIADEPLTETVPLQRPARGDESSPVLMTQYAMDPVAKLGLLKMDFLGLTNLTILDRTIKLLDRSQGVKIDLSRLPLDDPKAFELLSSGRTTDLFQLESAGMQRYIKELKPSTLGDIAAMIALYRPGPMEQIEKFIGAKHGRIPITYPHPSLKELLDETYGVIVYQDQVLLILQTFAGYSLGQADIVRKAMGKKMATLMAKEREGFIAGAEAKGFDHDLAVAVFDLIEPFAGYAFNKAHSVSYALISYWTAYFKSHYPLEYMVSVLNSRLDHPDKTLSSINECFKMGIPVLLPDINRSGEFFAIDKDASGGAGLRFGLAAVKTVGGAAVRPLVDEREKKGPYQSIDDFCRRADVRGLNRRTLESLAKAGAFDSLGLRGAVLEALDQIIATAQLEAKMRDSGQTSMFAGVANSPASSSGTGDIGGGVGIELKGADAPAEQKQVWEIELLGLSLSYNPAWELATLNAGDALTSVEQLDEEMRGQSLTILGYVSGVSERYTKEQKRFLIITMDLLGGPVEIVAWPDVLERTEEFWMEGRLLRVSGRLRVRGDQLSVSCERVEEYSPERSLGTDGPGNGSGILGSEDVTLNNANRSRTILVGITESGDTAEDAHLLREVVRLLLEYSGKDRVNLAIHTNGRRVLMDLPAVSTNYCEELGQRLMELLGRNNVTMQQTGEPDVAAAPY